MSKSPPNRLLRKRLSAQIRRRREALGWTQEMLAEKAGLSQVYISNVETCKRAVSIDVVERLAKALSAAPELLLVD